MEDIKVYVVKFQDRYNFAMKYTAPHTGQNVRRSTGTTKRKEAEKIAAKWEAELQEGRYQKRSRMSWEEFCERFELDGESDVLTHRLFGRVRYWPNFSALVRAQSGGPFSRQWSLYR